MSSLIQCLKPSDPFLTWPICYTNPVRQTEKEETSRSFDSEAKIATAQPVAWTWLVSLGRASGTFRRTDSSFGCSSHKQGCVASRPRACSPWKVGLCARPRESPSRKGGMGHPEVQAGGRSVPRLGPRNADERAPVSAGPPGALLQGRRHAPPWCLRGWRQGWLAVILLEDVLKQAFPQSDLTG